MAHSDVPDSDILATARLMLRSYGQLARDEAARRRDEFLTDGDAEGISIWTRICKALDSLPCFEDDVPGTALH